MDSDSEEGSMEILASSTDDLTSNGDTDAEVPAFDTDLPAAHNYLGDMERVSGVQYLEPNRNYCLPIIIHNFLVFPGETLPMILSSHMFVSADFNSDGFLFGLVFRELLNTYNSKLFGVTCQIYEKSSDDSDNISIKSRAYQRFYIKNEEFTIRNRTRYATVTILPEIELSHPIYGYDSNSLSKFRKNEEMKCQLIKYQSKSIIWPEFVYKMYDVSIACEKIKRFLTTLKIETVPMDLVSMSFWFCQNAILSSECRHKAFLTNSVTERILLVCQTLQCYDKIDFKKQNSIFVDVFEQEEKYIVCKQCRGKIAKYDSLFPMSKEGVRTNFCNSHGFIHDTHTITDALPDAIKVSGELTSEFCWFPGYMWRYVHCAHCNDHLGWKYISRNLMPKSFLGLSGNQIYFDSVSNLQMDSNASTVEADSSADEW